MTRENKNGISGWANFASGDSGTSKDIWDLNSEARADINDVYMSYDDGATATATVEVYDETAGTSAGNASDKIAEYLLDPGESFSISGISRDEVDKGLIAVVNGNDSNIVINYGGDVVIG